MSLALLLPGALVALVALALPVLIHLARRDERARIDFAALRWLAPEARPRRRLRLEERALLAARLALLALIALWLAQPALFGAGDARPFVVVMPGAQIDPSLLPPEARLHRLAPGFPALDAPAADTPQPIASLLRQLDAELDPAAPLIVLATATFDGADAEIPRLSRAVDWRVVPGTPPAQPVAPEPEPPFLHLVSDPAHAAGARYLQAAAVAWHPSGEPPALHGVGDALRPGAAGVVAWLSDAPLTDALQTWIIEGGTALLPAEAGLAAFGTPVPLWRDADGSPLAESTALGHGRLLRLTRALDPNDLPLLLEPEFPLRLRALLQPPEAEPERADARGWRPTAGAPPWPEAPRELRPWLALLIALVFALERWLATRDARWGFT